MHSIYITVRYTISYTRPPTPFWSYYSILVLLHSIVRATLKHCGDCTITQADRGENQREKSKGFPLLVSPYYTTPDYDQGYYLVCTDPALHRPLTDPWCTYTSCFTSMVIPEVKVERSSDLRVEWSSEMGVEQSSDSKSRPDQSSDLEAEWNLEQQKCEMGHPLTSISNFMSLS